jgi:hypothetical protein
MRLISLLGSAFMLLPANGFAQDFPSDTASIQALERPQYMEAGTCTPSTNALFGWEANQLARCNYTVGQGANRRFGVVYLHKIESAVILRWVKSACTLARPQAIESCTIAGVRGVIGSSGGQFPVGGIVWEDMDNDGRFEGYLFRNGVTVRDARWRNGERSQPDETSQTALATSPSVTGASSGYARIFSTERSQYRQLSGDQNISTGATLTAGEAVYWSDLVGKITRESVTRAFNPLIDAKICSQVGAQASKCLALAKRR